MMDEQTFTSLFKDCFYKNGLDAYAADPHVVSMFYRFAVELTETNKVMNLTALREMETVIPLHFADCALCCHYIPPDSTVLDVGCGGGFPSIPLAILRPDLSITALDSTAKKIVFVQRMACELGLSNLQAHAGRAEEWAFPDDPGKKRGAFDVVISRAVARLPVLSELCLPFVKTGGLFVAMKGAEAAIEQNEAKKAIAALGGSAPALYSYTLQVGEQEEKRGLVISRKEKLTPPQYPRSFGKIKKSPL